MKRCGCYCQGMDGSPCALVAVRPVRVLGGALIALCAPCIVHLERAGETEESPS